MGGCVGWRGVLALVCAVLLGACRDAATASGTSLYVTLEFEPTLLLTQVRVWGSVEGGRAFGPHLLPDQPERLLQSGETLRVLLEDAPNGAVATVYVEGLSNNDTVARGEGSVPLRDGYEMDVSVRLEPSSSSGADGGGSFCPSCSGCCYQGLCTSSTFNTCGTGGINCVMCDPARTDTCAPRGVCVCGTGPACTWPSADRCVGGQCLCGGGAACGPGQECVDGACRCTSNTCSGCCSGDVCRSGTTRDMCGKGGQACSRCNKTCTADRTCG